jgi:hypothetical protein
MKYKIRIVIIALFMSAVCDVYAALFASADKAFGIDLPASWTRVENDGFTLSLKKDDYALRFRRVDGCGEEACLRLAIDKELSFAKAKKFKILENAYTGEIIKRKEFSTGDPLYSFSFSGLKNDFTSAAFLADGKAYIANLRGPSYVESDFLLSFISPAPKLTDGAGRDYAVLAEETELSEHNLTLPDIAAAAPARETARAALKSGLFSRVFAAVILIWFSLFSASFFIKTAFGKRERAKPSNPKSGYPVKGERLYGSPDLFFKIRDNQGDNFICCAGRWGGFLMGCGLFLALLSFVLRTIAAGLYGSGYHPVVLNTAVSLLSLLIDAGGFVFLTGLLWDVLARFKITVYDNSGARVFKCRRKLRLFCDEYVLYAAKNAVLFKMERRRFSIRRKWTLSNAQGNIARVEELSASRALLRLCFGHLSGFLRCVYKIDGDMESSGFLRSQRGILTRFICVLDKPAAVPHKIMLAASAVIFIRDRDKWFPWVN